MIENREKVKRIRETEKAKRMRERNLRREREKEFFQKKT